MASGTYSNTRKKTVSPSNMGNRLVFNNTEKRYDVDVEDLVNQISGLQTTINQQATKISQLETVKESLENQLTTIRESLNMPCEVSIKTVGSYTVEAADNVIVSTGGTITFPTSLPKGRSFTIIRKGNSVNLDGVITSSGKTLYNNNSAATVLVVEQGTNMAFGALK